MTCEFLSRRRRIPAPYISRHGRTRAWLTGLLCSNWCWRWRSSRTRCPASTETPTTQSIRKIADSSPNFLTYAHVRESSREDGVGHREYLDPTMEWERGGNVEDRRKCHILTGFRGSFRRYRVCKARKSAPRTRSISWQVERRWAKKGAKGVREGRKPRRNLGERSRCMHTGGDEVERVPRAGWIKRVALPSCINGWQKQKERPVNAVTRHFYIYRSRLFVYGCACQTWAHVLAVDPSLFARECK